MSLSSFFSSFLNVVHADADVPAEQEEKVESTTTHQEETAAEAEVEEAAAEEEAEEPEDPHPIIREECKNVAKCAPLTRHFEHCQEKVSSGQGHKGEDCVEELMMHCVDTCAAPKLFAKLK
ncbi:Non-heme 11 kDa protein of cytochrome bc1 complex [Pisolithus orientalis]|uniref:Non-heme 11 kDa protein of cytochrome bc1 complex n=1 Tax=Pisolithus orientalis TaxID=936130 RepID=UPI0022252F23|nr:Non-heme 11 kDa protein of cytochrome bc1 complex [Pisolithus orientalis]KAI6003217.1 Non-heme 11 kDa protein of cytochrome bc1 complex [Pisolithus orientalis]